jgi:hypothetical protein
VGGMSSRFSRAAFQVYSLPRTSAIERLEARGVFRGAPRLSAAGRRPPGIGPLGARPLVQDLRLIAHGKVNCGLSGAPSGRLRP